MNRGFKILLSLLGTSHDTRNNETVPHDTSHDMRSSRAVSFDLPLGVTTQEKRQKSNKRVSKKSRKNKNTLGTADSDDVKPSKLVRKEMTEEEFNSYFPNANVAKKTPSRTNSRKTRGRGRRTRPSKADLSVTIRPVAQKELNLSESSSDSE